MNVCYCGTQAGYPHWPDCPYPLFHATPAQERDWTAKREAHELGRPCSCHPEEIRP